MSPSPATFQNLVCLIIPVFALVGVGALLRRVGWIEGAAEASLIRLVVKVCYPCLTFDAVFGNPALRDSANLLAPPLAGFGLTVLGIATAAGVARLLGLGIGTGLRTFAVSAGIANYAYLPIPIIAALWGTRATGVLFMHNVGVDAAVWTVGLVVLGGSAGKKVWRPLVNPVFGALFTALVLNAAGLPRAALGLPLGLVHALSACAVPLGLVITGVTIAEFLAEPAQLVHARVAVAACVVRLAVMPLLILSAAVVLPFGADLRRILIVQAAMPSGVIAIILAREYGGQPLTAVRIVLATTLAALVTCPLWIRAGLLWAHIR